MLINRAVFMLNKYGNVDSRYLSGATIDELKSCARFLKNARPPERVTDGLNQAGIRALEKYGEA